MSKHTHRGICQICGREQAVRNNGRIAKHGYEVIGFFHGTCRGSDRAPLQVESTYAQDHADDMELRANIILDNINLERDTITRRNLTGRSRDLVQYQKDTFESIHPADRGFLSWAELVDFAKREDRHRAAFLLETAKEVEARIAKVFGTALKEVK